MMAALRIALAQYLAVPLERAALATRLRAREARRLWLSRLGAPFFRADVTCAADPLAPDADVVAESFGAAARLCSARGEAVRLLVCPVPGVRVAVELSSVRSVVRVRVGRREAEAGLPRFTLGAAPSVADVPPAGLRLVFEPGPRALRLRPWPL